MLSDLKLQRLVRAAENLAEREAESGLPRRSSTPPLDAVQAEPIVSYLLEPYETGYWELKAEWNPASRLAKYLLEKLETTADLEKDVEANGFMPSAAARKLVDEKRVELLRVTSRLSAINALFRAAKVTEEGGELPRLSEIDSWIARIDLAKLRTDFAQAHEIFSQSIHFEGLQTGFVSSRPYRTKAGLLILLSAPREGGGLHVVAMSRAELSTLRDFYRALGVVEADTFQRVFAPDEALFKPYFALVSSVLTHIVHDAHISRVFVQALAYYDEEDFQHCISSLGLIAEDYIQRIYTTLLREPLPGNLTLGQTLERLNRRLDDYLPQQRPLLRSADPIYDLLRALPPNADAGALTPAIRELIQLVLDDRQYFGKRVEDLSRPPTRRTVFPPKVTDVLNELLKWRNAASHNSRIPLGAHEADRTLYCLVTIIAWWQKQLASQDWAKSRVDLIEGLVAAART